MPPSLSLSPAGRVALVTCSGELDVANAGSLRRTLRDAVALEVAVVVVDLGSVTFLDSTVLGALVEAHRALPPPRRLVVAGATGLPLRALQITGLDGVLELGGPRLPLGHDDLDALAQPAS